MKHSQRLLLLALALVLAAGAALAQPASSRGPTFTGPRTRMGHGFIYTWVTLDPADRPVSIGVTFSQAALTGLPNVMPYKEYVLAFPRQAAGVPFTHFVANWNPKGHFPQQVYGAPHFDFHFYLISPAVRRAMTLTGDNRTLAMKTPPQAAVPPGYMTVPGAEEAHMGVHWVSGSAPELHGAPFGQTFVYGYYAGQLAFLEPMMTRAYLQGGPDLTATIALPSIYPVTGYYPTQYSVRYDRRTRLYTIALEGLTLRRASSESPTQSASAGSAVLPPITPAPNTATP